MPVSFRPRQWDIYRVNIGEGPDCLVLIVSSDETHEALESTVLACEVVPEAVQKHPSSPVFLSAKSEDTGLNEPATLSVATLSTLPRNCLVNLEGRLGSASLRAQVYKAVDILMGSVPWP